MYLLGPPPPADLLARGTSLAHLSDRAWVTVWLAVPWLETGAPALVYVYFQSISDVHVQYVSYQIDQSQRRT